MLYEDHVERLARYVGRRTSADVVQDVVAETFLIAWRRLDDLPEDQLPWLIVTARNVMANRRRSAARDRALTEKVTASPGWRFEPRAAAEMDEIDQRLIHAIQELPDAEREAFMLIAWDGLNPTRAATAAGCSPATFRMRLHRARRRLRRQVGEVHPLSRRPELTTPLEEAR